MKMVTRRRFIQTITTGAAAAVVVNPLFPMGSVGERKLKNIGYISGIIGKELKGDWKAVLRETVKYGYNEIEIGQFLGESAKTFLKYCSEIGIKPVAGGATFSKNMDEVNKSLDLLNELELKYAVIYWPWLKDAPFKLESCKITAEMLNQIGAACRKKGLMLCWHNHNKEFVAMEEGMPFDYLMNHTDKSLVKCEMDIYWVQKGGAVPLEMLKKYRDRYSILHVKDMAQGTAQDFACPGSGIIDFPSVFSEAADQGIEHYFVERDNVVDGMACLKTSADYLKKISFR
jgi:sugar phosphate isomerase/epimerase